jgi:putative ABC transport system permease protein
MIAPDAILFYPRVALGVYLYPIVGVYFYPIVGAILILAILGILVNRHLRKVDILEALKSVE